MLPRITKTSFYECGWCNKPMIECTCIEALPNSEGELRDMEKEDEAEPEKTEDNI